VSFGKKTALLFFFSGGISRWQKNKCAVCALAFFVQMFKFSSISALLTTCFNQTFILVYRIIVPDKPTFWLAL